MGPLVYHTLHCGLQASAFLLPACVYLLLLPAMDSEFISHPLSSSRLLEEPLNSHSQVSLPRDRVWTARLEESAQQSWFMVGTRV